MKAFVGQDRPHIAVKLHALCCTSGECGHENQGEKELRPENHRSKYVRSGQQLIHQFAMYICQAHIEALKFDCQFRVIKPQ